MSPFFVVSENPVEYHKKPHWSYDGPCDEQQIQVIVRKDNFVAVVKAKDMEEAMKKIGCSACEKEGDGIFRERGPG